MIRTSTFSIVSPVPFSCRCLCDNAILIKVLHYKINAQSCLFAALSSNLATVFAGLIAAPMEQIDFVTIEEQQRPRKRNGVARKPAAKKAAKSQRPGAVRDGYRRLTADIPADLHKRLKMQALMEDRSVTELIVQAAECFLRNRD
jgi:hypothetical protein